MHYVAGENDLNCYKISYFLNHNIHCGNSLVVPYSVKFTLLLKQSTLRVHAVKPVLSDHSEIDKTKAFRTNGSLMKVESIAECSLGAFCNTFDQH